VLIVTDRVVLSLEQLVPPLSERQKVVYLLLTTSSRRESTLLPSVEVMVL
jgi:hypothetical protein